MVQTKTALILDDEPLCLDMMREILEEKGFSVTTFNDPISCLEELDEHCKREAIPCFDIILADNQMPHMTGLEFLQFLKSKGCKLPDHCKALISGSWDQDQVEQARELGCRIFYKPTPIETIYQWLHEQSAA